MKAKYFSSLFPLAGVAAIATAPASAAGAAILLPVTISRGVWMGILCAFLVIRQPHSLLPATAGLISCLAFWARPWKKKWAFLAAGIPIVFLLLHRGHLWSQIIWRIETWLEILRMSLQKPLFGEGFYLLALPMALKSASPLPGAHSDWLSLAFHGGWLSVLAAGAILKALCFPLGTGPLRAARCSLVCFSILAAVQDAFSMDRVALIVLGLVAWLLAEKSEEKRNALA